jgi:hypothetical protein
LNEAFVRNPQGKSWGTEDPGAASAVSRHPGKVAGSTAAWGWEYNHFYSNVINVAKTMP